MRNLTKFSAVFCLAFSTPAFCGEWWHIGTAGENPNRVAYFADAQSASPQGSVRRVWVERVLETAGDQNELSLKSLYMFDCAEMKMSEMQRYLFNDQNKSISSPRLAPSWDYVPPDTMAARLQSFICNGTRDNFAALDGETPISYSQNRVFSNN